MCNDFANRLAYSEYVAACRAAGIEVAWPAAAPNLEPRNDIWPTDVAPVIRRLDDGSNEFAQLRWGFPPGRPKAPPVINFRSEGRRFSHGRCLVPASWFYEFTGSKSPKTKWKFTKTGEEWFCFAGLWRPMPQGSAAFTLLTTAPGADVAPIHDRQMVILNRVDWSRWLGESGNEAELLRALRPGSLTVEQVASGSARLL
jgi:putative SOS response-associated peptidase YedK